MFRAGKNFVIKNEDLANGSVKKKQYKDLTEYWIYRERISDIIGAGGGRLKTGKFYLHGIVVCQNNHITLTTPDRIEVQGVRFTNDIRYGMDLDDYLSKTNRSL